MVYSERQIDEWIELNRTPWEQFYPWYVHELPEFWVIDALITERVIEKIGAAGEALVKERDRIRNFAG